MKTVIGLFDTAADAYEAQNDLLGSGLERDRLSIVSKAPDGPDSPDAHRTDVAEGAGVGAVAGGVAGGVLASLGLLAIPGIGPFLAAGPIIAFLTGAGIGAAAGGVVGALIGVGIPAEEAELYAEGIHRGGTLLTVHAADLDADRVATILTQHNAIDVDKRAAQWTSAGWQRTAPADDPDDPDPAGTVTGLSARGSTATSGTPFDPRTHDLKQIDEPRSSDDPPSDESVHNRGPARIYRHT